MPIDASRAVGAALPGSTYSWDEDDVVLYQLAIGAGVPPTDARELSYTYDADLRVLPTFATIPAFGLMMSLGTVDGLEFELASVLHGEQELELHRPIPSSGSVVQEGRVTHVFDKGKGALVVMEIESRLEKDGELLFTNRPSVFLRGEGGFGGEPGPPTTTDIPDRDPDQVVRSPTLPQQALLYRVASGDRNPLHTDPGFAAFAGYERPILHGLCTYGIVGKAVVDHSLGGQVRALIRYRARFSGVVFPGETVVTRTWVQDGGLVVEAAVEERAATVLSGTISGHGA